MFLTLIILVSSALALAVLALLDCYVVAVDRAHAKRRAERPEGQNAYDPFTERH